MSTQQPEALRLAARLDPVHSYQTPLPDLRREAASELRRLHALNTELLKVLRMARAKIAADLQVMAMCHTGPDGLIDDAEAALLIDAEQDLVNQIDEAITKATGEQA